MSERRLKVLLVDDEPEFLDVLATRMEARGINVETARSGEQAVEKGGDPSIDAIVLDLAMPGIDGLETLRRLLELDPIHQVIILTGQASLEKGMEAISLGALDVLEKPVPLTVLLDKIEEAAKRKQRIAAAQPQRSREPARQAPSRRPKRVPLSHRVFPFFGWLKESRGAALRADMLSGLTVALVLIPQSMAYAQLAGLPAYYGLYASFLPPMIAALFGSSRQLATGPVAVVSLMTAAALEPLATAGSEAYIAYAILLALLVGVFQFLLGALRLGLVVNFLSHPVVNGFTNAAALIIATSQLSKVFGVEVDKAEHHYETVLRVVEEATRSMHWPTFGMAVLAFAIMIVLKKVNRRIPNVLVAVAVTTILSWGFSFERRLEVPLGQVASPEVRETIRSFNAVVTERREIESFRTSMNKEAEQAFAPGKPVCTRCHDARSVDLFKQKVIMSPPSEMSGRVLLLHHSAELLDARIQELKNDDEARLRRELRDLEFTHSTGGEGLVFVAGNVPDGIATDGYVWQLKVANRPLGLEALPLRSGGAVVGTIPKGLPSPEMPQLRASVVFKLLPVAMIISILGFMEAISIAKAMAARTHQRLDPNQELIGQGLANAVGSVFQSYAVSGSFSRSAVNFQAGAVTGLSNAFSSAVVVITLLVPDAAALPPAPGGAGSDHHDGGCRTAQRQGCGPRVEGTVVRRVDLGSDVRRHSPGSAAPRVGIATGVAMSLGAYLYRTMHPNVAQLAVHPDGSLRDAARHELGRCKYIAAIRFDGPLNFASCSYLEDAILNRVSEMPSLRHVLIVAHGINELDASGEEMLEMVLHRLRETGCRVSFSGLKDNVIDVLRRTRLWDQIGEENTYPTQLIALRNIYESAHAGGDEDPCPLAPPRLIGSQGHSVTVRSVSGA